MLRMTRRRGNLTNAPVSIVPIVGVKTGFTSFLAHSYNRDGLARRGNLRKSRGIREFSDRFFARRHFRM
jgi:hypothetical protein